MRLSPEEVIEKAGDRLVVCEDVEALHRRFAEDMAGEMEQSNAAGRPLRLIVPVGPTGQYPILVEMIRQRGLSLANCTLFFMDEYCADDGDAVDRRHPLSLKGHAYDCFIDKLSGNAGLREDRIVFPNEDNIAELAAVIEKADGIDTCYGGIGIHGHVAFNEPAPGVVELGPRRVTLNDFTVTINAIRAGVGGNLECFPRQAYTLGMREILNARTIRLYCRNGCEFDWANTVLRLALFGTPGDDYPVTHIRDRNYVITTDRHTLASPRKLL